MEVVKVSSVAVADLPAMEAHFQVMDVMESNAATEAPVMEGGLVSFGMEAEESNVIEDLPEVDFQKQLRETIAGGSLDFDTWTSLISDIENYYPDDIETISLVYDSFLSKFPLCHVYWKKYADHKTHLCTVDKAVEVFERAVQSATYCVALWVDYCSFSIAAFEDPFEIRRLFNRGLSFVRKDYLCHTLWDKYIEFEYSQHQWSFLLKILIQTLRFPTKKLHKYYDNLKKFAAIFEEEMECQNNCSNEVQSEGFPDAAVIISENEIYGIVKDLQNPSNDSLRSQALQKYLSIGEQFYHTACQLDGKIHCFENSIGRSFFHVKPLDDSQLANWHSYLDFIEKQEDFDWTVKLYERCLIPCAKYPEFWMRYVEFMETKGGRELANFALERATQIFLENAPVIHIFNARFREQIGDTYGARAAFLQGDADSDSYFVENVIKAANMEKRLGNLVAASSIYEKALTLAAARQKLHTVPILYIHFSRLKYLIAGSVDAAVNVIIDGIEHVPNCRLLLEELIKFVMMHEGSKHINAVDSIVANAIATGPDIHSLSAKDREDLSCLYLEFIDLCGTNHDVRKAWNRHIKLFPHLIRTTYSYEHPTAPNQLLEMAREARKRTPSAFPNQPSNSHGSDHLTQLPVPEQEPLPPENHVIQLDQVVAEQSQQKEDANSAQEGKQELPFGVLVESIEDVAEAHESKHDLVHQSGDDVSGAFESTKDMVCHSRIDASGLMELNHDLIQQSEEAASGQIESSHEFEQPAGPIAPSEFLRESSISPQKQEIEVDNELEKHLKPIHFENLSPSYQEKESQDLMAMELQEHDVCQKISRSDGDILQLGPSTKEIIDTASPKSSPTAALAGNQNELDKNDSVKPSSSTSHQSPTQRHSELQREVPSNSGEDSCQDFMTTASRGTSPNLHEHSHDLQQQDSLQKLRSSAEMGAQMQVRNVSQGGNQHHSGVAQGHVTTSHAGPVQDVQNPSNVSAPLSQPSPQPVVSHPQAHMSQYTSQTSEQNGLIQNSQAYNQMLQYHFQQQQLLQQQYQQQMLQMQHPYFQLQQQQLYQQQPAQQQQHNQPQQLMFQHQHYLQQSQQLQQPPYQAEQQQYLLYLQQQLQQQQQLQPGQQEQCTQLEGQEHQRQLQQFYQLEGNAHQQNQQGYQLLLQQYQVQQQQQYQQLLQQHQLQQQQGHQQLLLQHQLQQQQITPAHNQSSSNYQQGQGLKPSRNKDAAGPSEPLNPQQSPEGMLQPQSAGERRHHVSPHHHQHSPHGVPASRRARTSLSPTLGD